jgi:hypothetical protein
MTSISKPTTAAFGPGFGTSLEAIAKINPELAGQLAAATAARTGAFAGMVGLQPGWANGIRRPLTRGRRYAVGTAGGRS